MKRFFISILILFFTLHFAYAEKITLQWDLPEDQIDGIRIYQRTYSDSKGYDFSNPIATLEPGETSVVVDIPGVPNDTLKYMWVARAFRGDVESANSNEVSYKVVNTVPLSPINLAGDYNQESKIVSLSWDQPVEKWHVHHWIVYYRIGDEAEFTELGRVNKDNDLQLSKEFDPLPENTMETFTFAVVAFRRSGVFSENSNEISIVIDKRTGEVPAVENFRINIEIPI